MGRTVYLHEWLFFVRLLSLNIPYGSSHGIRHELLFFQKSLKNRQGLWAIMGFNPKIPKEHKLNTMGNSTYVRGTPVLVP